MKMTGIESVEVDDVEYFTPDQVKQIATRLYLGGVFDGINRTLGTLGVTTLEFKSGQDVYKRLDEQDESIDANINVKNYLDSEDWNV
jgi:hypothetical protein